MVGSDLSKSNGKGSCERGSIMRVPTMNYQCGFLNLGMYELVIVLLNSSDIYGNSNI